MTEMADYESLLASRFAALATPDRGDWLDVRRRARRMRLRRAALLIAAMVAAALVATPALGLHRVVIDMFGAEPARLPDGQRVSLPAKAIVDEARKLIDFRAENGEQVTLWVMPTTDGGLCYVHNRGYGCPRPGLDEPHPLGAGPHGGAQPVLIAGQVRSDVAIYELRYEDGTVERLEPVEGFILHEIASRHYAPGHRLDRVRALDRAGEVLAQLPVHTGSGVYPCEKPVDIGDGVMFCP